MEEVTVLSPQNYEKLCFNKIEENPYDPRFEIRDAMRHLIIEKTKSDQNQK